MSIDAGGPTTKKNHLASGVRGATMLHLPLWIRAATTYQATLSTVRITQSIRNAKDRAPGPATGSATSTPVTLSTARSEVRSITPRRLTARPGIPVGARSATHPDHRP